MNNNPNLKKLSSHKKQKRKHAKADPKTDSKELALQAADARESDFIARWLSDVIVIRPGTKDGDA